MTRHSAVYLLVLFIAIFSPQLGGQQIVRRFEVGTQTTMLRTLGKTDVCSACPTSYWSVGPALTVNINRNFALDASFFAFPGSSDNPSWFVGGHVTQTLAGLKAGVHGRRFSLFTKVRPGYVRWSRGRIANIEFPNEKTYIKDGVVFIDPGDPVYSYKPRTNFALELGGGIQYALSPNVSLRADMSDTIIRWHKYDSFWEFSAADFPSVSHNVQLSTGVFYRFGTSIPVEQPTQGMQHRFWDKTNIALLSASVLAQSADAITTQRFMANCRDNWTRPPNYPYGCEQKENNPLARPFVQHGWGGQIALGAIVNTAQSSVAYGLHKMGHHRIERFVTIPLTLGSAYFAYKNLQR